MQDSDTITTQIGKTKSYTAYHFTYCKPFKLLFLIASKVQKSSRRFV